ncbi:hypothetical protein Gotur_034576 [Gossypium turneri]
MNSQNQVESTLKEIVEVVKPLHEDWVTRFKIINELREVVQSIENLRGATVEPFGSFVSNLFSRGGDLDISIEVSFGQCVSSAGKKQKQALLGELLRALRKQGGWSRLKFIPSARVPILKIVSKWQNISCDISIDNLQGEIKSKFLLWLNEIDGRFRDMVLLVKEWAKANGINNPKTGTFNSYSLSLLVIFHFQTCVPPILPPLKDIYPTNVVDDLTDQFSSEAPYRLCLCQVFKYFSQFSEINSKALELGICTFTGQWEYIANNTRWLPRTYAIFIEDPFEQPENSARAVGQKQLVKIAEVFETTRRSLISANITRNTLLPTLVGPQTSRFLIKKHPTVYSNSNYRYYPNTPLQAHRVVQSPLQTQYHLWQPQYKNSRPSTSQMQHQGPRMVPSTPKPKSQFARMRVPNGPSLPNHQFQKPNPSVPQDQVQVQVQPQVQRARTEGYNVKFGTRRPHQVQHNQGQMWRPKYDK